MPIMKTGILAALLFVQTSVPRLPPATSNPSGPSVQSPLDSNYTALIETCRTPPAAAGGGAPGAGRGGARGAAPPESVRDSVVTNIPDVIAAGAKWTFVWQQAGN